LHDPEPASALTMSNMTDATRDQIILLMLCFLLLAVVLPVDRLSRCRSAENLGGLSMTVLGMTGHHVRSRSSLDHHVLLQRGGARDCMTVRMPLSPYERERRVTGLDHRPTREPFLSFHLGVRRASKFSV
jgi:hypothetical protein